MDSSRISEIALQILKASIGRPVFYIDQIIPDQGIGTNIIHGLRRRGIPMDPTLDGGFRITAEARLRLAILTLRGGVTTVYEVSRYLDWKEFETLTSSIFEGNEYFVFQNYRFTQEHKRNEIDVIAIKTPLAIVADAKHYSETGRGSIKSAVAAQKSRAKFLIQYMSENSDCPLSGMGITKLLPLIITWLAEAFYIHMEVAIVPIFKLNSFLLSLDYYQDKLCYIPAED